MIWQVDNFSLACDNGSTAVKIFDIIAAELRSAKEEKDPFTHPGRPVKAFNEIDAMQAQTHTKSSCSNHIDQMMTSHGRETSLSEDDPNSASPLQMDVLGQLPRHADGPKEGELNSKHCKKIKDSHTNLSWVK